jgi:lipopolysaccharide assembly outer membrane protein LptD (OstA)
MDQASAQSQHFDHDATSCFSDSPPLVNAAANGGLRWRANEFRETATELTLDGNVRFDFDGYITCADRIVSSKIETLLTASGSVTVREPNGNIIKAEKYHLTEVMARAMETAAKDRAR